MYLTTTLEELAWEFVPSGGNWTLYRLYEFNSNGGIYGMLAGLTVGPGGNLYGGITLGGPVVFELSPSNGGWTYSTLYTFSSTGPSANLVMDSAGNLYGTTLGDEEDGSYGSVFKLTPSNGSWTYTDLHDFTNGSDGGYPYSSVLIDAAGNLYGTASTGGSGNGVVWEITP